MYIIFTLCLGLYNMKSAKIFEKVLENVESLLDILTRKWNFNQVPGPVADMALFS